MVRFTPYDNQFYDHKTNISEHFTKNQTGKKHPTSTSGYWVLIKKRFETLTSLALRLHYQVSEES